MSSPNLSLPRAPMDSACFAGDGHCQSAQLNAEILESLGAGLVVFQLERRSLTFVNRSARELFARLEQPIDFDSLAELLAPPGTPLAEISASQKPRTLHLGTRLVEVALYRSQDVVWALLHDNTDKARLESIAEAVEMMNNIGFAFSALRHELGNPVNSIKAALSVLRADLDRYSREAIRDYLERMTYEVGRVEGLLRSMKSFSMYEDVDNRFVDLNGFLSTFARLVREEAARRGISLEIDCDCEGSPCAFCDPRALQQVLLNVFTNAADAVAGREGAMVRIDATRSGGLVYLRIQDNGPGIPDEEQKNLFKPFFTSKAKGTGLGLVISRKLLARMAGTISLSSSPGQGTTVLISVPECSRC